MPPAIEDGVKALLESRREFDDPIDQSERGAIRLLEASGEILDGETLNLTEYVSGHLLIKASKRFPTQIILDSCDIEKVELNVSEICSIMRHSTPAAPDNLAVLASCNQRKGSIRDTNSQKSHTARSEDKDPIHPPISILIPPYITGNMFPRSGVHKCRYAWAVVEGAVGHRPKVSSSSLV
jgi:hypothetical protein